MADVVRRKLKRDFDAVAAETFDIIVIGGGIIGAGIARDATLRGFRTLLVDKEDFAYGTTSRSSRLIHGGLRYLKRLDLGLVRQDLREREILLHIAPHLVHPLAFVIPISSTRPLQRAALPFGLMLYDLLFYRKSLPSHRRLSRSETLKLEPGLEQRGLVGSYLYYDCQSPFVERLCLENVLSASEHGATNIKSRQSSRALEKQQWRVRCRSPGYDVREKLTRSKQDCNQRNRALGGFLTRNVGKGRKHYDSEN